jgi:hypothetical protein
LQLTGAPDGIHSLARGTSLAEAAGMQIRGMIVLLVLSACGADGGELQFAALEDTNVPVAEAIELAVTSTDMGTGAVDFYVDDQLVGTCDPSQPDEDCQLGELYRWTIVLPTLGMHTVVAKDHDTGAGTATLQLTAVPAEVERPDVTDGLQDEDIDELRGAAGAPSTTIAAASRGFLDPARSFHSIFGGIQWKVSHQRVVLHSGTPTGSVSAVQSCMHRYGASIRHWADHYGMSRASIVATALTESNCTNPAGSSDGLSSGPMQVTASTCAALMGLSRATCRSRMHTSPDFSFRVSTKYMASAFQTNQHRHDPPKIAAAYNAGSLRKSFANHWHLVTTGNHIDRFVRAYNAYRKWETVHNLARTMPEPTFDGQHVADTAQLPADASDGEVVFVGDFASRTGSFYQRVDGQWLSADAED